MPAKKRTQENVWQLTFDVFYLGMPLKKAAGLNDLSKKTAQLALNDAVGYGYITPEQRLEYIATAPSRGVDMKNSKYTQQELSLKYSDMGKKSAANGLERLTEQARKGGLATQTKHGKHVAKNLKNAKHYGTTACKYEDIWFASQGERMTALLLKEYGLIDNIIEGQNFQKEFGRFTVDFYINDNLIIEYHPIPRQTFPNSDVEVASSIDAYVRDRTEAIKDRFSGKIIAIPAPSGKFSATEFYNKLNQIGIQDTWAGFLERCRKIRNDISIFQKQYELELNSITPREDVPF